MNKVLMIMLFQIMAIIMIQAQGTLIIDNFTPYVQEVKIFSNSISIYDEYWTWNASSQKLEFSGRCPNTAAAGNGDVSLIVYTSEPMASLRVQVEDIHASFVNATPYNGSVQQWQVLITMQTIVNMLPTGKPIRKFINIQGEDLNGNSLQGFKKRDGAIKINDLTVRDAAGQWKPVNAVTTDEKHYLRIGNSLKSANECTFADFSANRTSVAINDPVTFINNSYGAITQWNWNFEGGNPSTSSDESPVVSYPNAGKFKVSLTISDGSDKLTETKEGYITVTSMANDAVLDFAYDPSENRFTAVPVNGAISYNWNLVSTAEPSIVYNIPANLDKLEVVLTVRFSDYSTKSKTQWVYKCGYPSNSQ
jgi:PKD repeat protein